MVANDSISTNDVNRELYIRNAELAVRNKTLALLHSMSSVTVRTLEIEEMVHEITHTLQKEFAYPFVAIALVDEKGKNLVWKSWSDVRGKRSGSLHLAELAPVALTSTDNLCAKALSKSRRQSTRKLENIFEGSDLEQLKKFVEVSHFESALIFPLVADDASLGVLVVGMDRSVKVLTTYERETFQSLLGLVTIALQKAETYERLQHTTKQLRVANHHLRELDAMKTEFLSIASHQLRTPLAVLKGYIGMLNGSILGPLTEKQKETLTRMDSGTEQLIMLVNHLLDVSRIESNRLSVRLETMDLRTVLTGLVKFLEAKAKEKNVALLYVPPTDAMMVSVDAEKIKEVFMNLLDNALKYTDEGSVTVNMRIEDGRVVVSVKDTGHGLTQEDQTKLFQKFVTGSASVKVRTTTGLGLYVVKKLVEAMKGTVAAESDGPEKGSVFTVALPVCKS
jgi:signal transduction histidine kinase